jgi:hypothetical protein
MNKPRITLEEKAPQPEGRGQRRATSLKGPEEGGATLREGGENPWVHVYDAALRAFAPQCGCRAGQCKRGYWGACSERHGEGLVGESGGGNDSFEKVSAGHGLCLCLAGVSRCGGRAVRVDQHRPDAMPVVGTQLPQRDARDARDGGAVLSRDAT